MDEPESGAVEAGGAFDSNVMEIDLGAITGNFAEIRRRIGRDRRLIAVLKADAYGHGAVAIARSVSRLGADYLASGNLAEAIAIRRAGIAAPIILLGTLSPEAIPHVIGHKLVPTLDDAGSAGALSRAAPSRVPVFIKIDCGFGRFGVALGEAASFVEHVAGLPNLAVEGIYTHLPFSDGAGRGWAERQTRVFDSLVAGLAARGLNVPIVQSLASPGLLTGLADGGTATAVGHLLYGFSPVSGELGSAAGIDRFRPALRAITTRLVHVGDRLRGEGAALYLRGGRGRLGVAAIGIQHGYRPALGAAFMIVGGTAAPILRVCIENTILDLGGHPGAAVGDSVVVVGAGGTGRVALQDLAAWQATSPLALLIGLGKSIPRKYIEP